MVAVRQLRKAWPAHRQINVGGAAALLRVARGFLLFNLIAAFVLQIDYIIMSQRAGPQDIVQYYNIARLFAFGAFFNQAILFAVWPRFSEQFAKGERADIRRALNRIVAYSSLLTAGMVGIVLLLSGTLSRLLSPGVAVEFRHTVILGFGALALIRCITDPYAIFLQSIGRLRPLIAFAALQALLGAALQWVLSGILGIEGILIALVLSFLLTVAWGLPRAALVHLGNAR
jgi:O-antigen/teichoic acid export membrane protein